MYPFRALKFKDCPENPERRCLTKMKVRYIECAVGNMEVCFWQGKNAKIVLILFLTSGFAVFIVSSSWYCQIQTCKLIMFFRQNDLKNPEMF